MNLGDCLSRVEDNDVPGIGMSKRARTAVRSSFRWTAVRMVWLATTVESVYAGGVRPAA